MDVILELKMTSKQFA